jgi:Rod binding domain-containing protein
MTPAIQAPSLSPAASDKQLFQTAQKWVAQTFFGTLLKQMHDSPFKSEMWSGGRGGQAFAPLMDQHLAERMASASGRGLARSIVKHIQRKAAPTAPPTQ